MSLDSWSNHIQNQQEVDFSADNVVDNIYSSAGDEVLVHVSYCHIKEKKKTAESQGLD